MKTFLYVSSPYFLHCPLPLAYFCACLNGFLPSCLRAFLLPIPLCLPANLSLIFTFCGMHCYPADRPFITGVLYIQYYLEPHHV
jgi:hypothetical protein